MEVGGSMTDFRWTCQALVDDLDQSVAFPVHEEDLLWIAAAGQVFSNPIGPLSVQFAVAMDMTRLRAHLRLIAKEVALHCAPLHNRVTRLDPVQIREFIANYPHCRSVMLDELFGLLPR